MQRVSLKASFISKHYRHCAGLNWKIFEMATNLNACAITLLAFLKITTDWINFVVVAVRNWSSLFSEFGTKSATAGSIAIDKNPNQSRNFKRYQHSLWCNSIVGLLLLFFLLYHYRNLLIKLGIQFLVKWKNFSGEIYTCDLWMMFFFIQIASIMIFNV